MVEVAARGFYLDFFFFMVFTDSYRMMIPILQLFARPPLYLAFNQVELHRTLAWTLRSYSNSAYETYQTSSSGCKYFQLRVSNILF